MIPLLALVFTTTTALSVTFNVDMSPAAGFIPGVDQVYIAGNFPGATWNEPGTNPSLHLAQVGSTLTYMLALELPDGIYDYKYFKNAGWGGGEYAGGSNRSATVVAGSIINDTWSGSITWANLQWPGTGAINEGGVYDVYAQAYIPNGITYATGATYGLQAWIGYNTSNTNPNTWTNWVPAPFFGQAFDNDEFKTDLGAAITAAGTYYYASRFQFGTGAYSYGGFSGTNGGFWDGTTNVSGVLNVNAVFKTLNLSSVLLEGLYDAAGNMKPANNENGIAQFAAPTVDQITVELHNSASYSNIEYTATAINLSNSGTATINIPAAYNASYFITIKHRNSIETTTAAAVSLVGSTISQSFSIANVYGGNLGLTPDGYYVIFSGDVDQNGSVDTGDFTPVDNDASNYNSGYIATDVNGDGTVDSGDFTSIDNNGLNYIGSSHP